MAPPTVSVCIASYRRPLGLARLLDSLRRQKLPLGASLEVLVVDNDPRGSALPQVPGGGPERYFHEPRRNIAHARNRALEEARGEWIAFIDDDEEADEDWLASYLRMAGDGSWDALFGPVIPRLERVVTPWLDPARFFARPRHPSGARVPLAEARTSNAFVRRALLAGQHFDPAYGLSGGSDSELFGRLARAGARFGFCDEARVVEEVPPERHCLGWLTRRAFRGGFVHTRIALGQRRARALRRGLPRALGAACLLTALLVPALLGGRAPAARVWLRLCTQAGHLWAFAGRDFVEYGERSPAAGSS